MATPTTSVFSRSSCFAMVFMDTAVTIPTGALAERWKWGSFVFFCFFMSMWAYPIFGNWVWGGGWLSQLGSQFGLGHGHVDFAGSSVVHMVVVWRLSWEQLSSVRASASMAKTERSMPSRAITCQWPSWACSFSLSVGLVSTRAHPSQVTTSDLGYCGKHDAGFGGRRVLRDARC